VHGTRAEGITLGGRPVEGGVTGEGEFGNNAERCCDIAREWSRQSHRAFLRTGPTYSGAKEAGSGLLRKWYQISIDVTPAPTRGISETPIRMCRVMPKVKRVNRLRRFRLHPLVEIVSRH
jgi:hypothetical protein